ncbi:MAG: XrtB/PEP-CTERM-associated polysaccharide biosynthesis outer membrane protein EpsL [Pseudomonadota bacterium]
MGRACPLALLLGALWLAPARAAPGDTLQFVGGLGFVHEDNLFRLADGQPPFDGQRGDSARQVLLGLVFDHTYGRQQVQAQAHSTRVTFDHFRQIDYNASDARLDWNWQCAEHLSGSTGASYLQTLAPYTDLRSKERNLRDQRRAWLDGAWRLHPSWQVRAAGARERFRYDLASLRYNNRDEDSAEAGLDYLPSSGSSVGLVARRLRGNYLELRPFGALLVDDSFKQDELKLRVIWKASAMTEIELLAGHASRRHQAGGARDASGFNGRASVSVDRGGKLRWNGAAWREFAPLESELVSYSLNQGASAGASYALSSKISIDASVRHERRAYRLPLGASQGELRDTLRQAALSASWSPRQFVQVVAGAARQQRSGAVLLGNGSFRATTMSLNVNAQF